MSGAWGSPPDPLPEDKVTKQQRADGSRGWTLGVKWHAGWKVRSAGAALLFTAYC